MRKGLRRIKTRLKNASQCRRFAEEMELWMLRVGSVESIGLEGKPLGGALGPLGGVSGLVIGGYQKLQ